MRRCILWWKEWSGREAELKRLRNFQSDIEEAEARCCPEDFGFEEWIGILTKRLAVTLAAGRTDVAIIFDHVDRRTKLAERSK